MLNRLWHKNVPSKRRRFFSCTLLARNDDDLVTAANLGGGGSAAATTKADWHEKLARIAYFFLHRRHKRHFLSLQCGFHCYKHVQSHTLSDINVAIIEVDAAPPKLFAPLYFHLLFRVHAL